MWQPTEPSTEPCGAASAQPAPSLAAASAASPQFTTRVSLSSPAPPTRRPNSRMYSRTAAATAASRRGRKPAAVPSAACSSAAPPPPAASIEPTDAAVRSTCVSHSKTLVPPPLVRAVVYAPPGLERRKCFAVCADGAACPSAATTKRGAATHSSSSQRRYAVLPVTGDHATAPPPSSSAALATASLAEATVLTAIEPSGAT
mmetsp:Transcript_45784/g.148860  ORF Transcript_45784/g.148860 Transcript_45784/m.148860 type:complete len:202 (-) Transcript_45784:521-1126(-)